MTQDEYEVGSLKNAEKFAIIRMAREAGFETEDWANGTHVIVYESGREIDITNELERLVALVVAHEREACAKLCENWDFNAQSLIKAIRARGEK